MHIVVLGGSGFVGSFLILKLLKEGHEVLNIDLNSLDFASYDDGGGGNPL